MATDTREPIALKGDDGVIRAWACPRCFRVSMSVSCGGRNGREREAEESRLRALKCGTCEDCGVVTSCTSYRPCKSCEAARKSKADAIATEHQQEWAERAAIYKVQRAAYLDGLLVDIPALRTRDWSDEEDLAAELMPLILARLAATD